jgi:hypothetical protein
MTIDFHRALDELPFVTLPDCDTEDCTLENTSELHMVLYHPDRLDWCRVCGAYTPDCLCRPRVPLASRYYA